MHQTRLKTFFRLTRMSSDWLRYRFWSKSDWSGINFNPKLLPGKISTKLVVAPMEYIFIHAKKGCDNIKGN